MRLKFDNVTFVDKLCACLIDAIKDICYISAYQTSFTTAIIEGKLISWYD